MWLLGAMALAASRRRSLGSAVGAGICVAIAGLSKETLLALLPAVVYLLWQHSDVRTRRYRLMAFATVTITLLDFYPLYAAVKSELLSGPGHVSLWWSVQWQLFQRAPNGSIFDPASGAGGYFYSWLHLDPWLLAVGVACLLPGLLIRSARPIAVGMLIQAVLLARPGYLPEAYVIAMLPFAALLVVTIAEHALRFAAARRRGKRSGVIAVVGALAVAACLVAPVWARRDTAQLTGGSDVPMAQAVSWVRQHVRPGQHIVVDDNVWLDLVRAGYDPRAPYWSVTWVYKVGTDPAVKLPPGVRAVDYFVYSMDPIYAAKDSPQIVPPYRNSDVVAKFGSGGNTITVRQVRH
jgi:hypothetical protein